MQHLDEGTVHAWLDGALPPDESERVSEHVSSCAACAALVAEARGLIAAASRILTALDDVPGGVIPAAPSRPGDVAPIARPVSSAATGPRRWFRVTSNHWRVAAAIAFLAGTSVLVSRVDRDEAPGTMSAESVAMDAALEKKVRGPSDAGDGASLAAGAAESSLDVAAPTAAPVATRTSPDAAPRSVNDAVGVAGVATGSTQPNAYAKSTKAIPAPTAVASPRAQGARAPRAAGQSESAREASPTSAREPSALPSPALAQSEERAASPSASVRLRGLNNAAPSQPQRAERQLSAVAPQAAPPQAAPQAAARRGLTRDSATRDAAAAGAKIGRPGAIGEAFGASSGAAAPRFGGLTIPACYRLSFEALSPALSAPALAAVRRIPTQIRLDSIPAGERDAERYVVRALAPTSAGIATDGEWAMGANEALLEWIVDGTSISVWLEAGSGSSLAGDVEVTSDARSSTGRVAAHRMACP